MCCRWQGECGEQSLKWFPSNHVEAIEDGLGSLQQGSIKFSKSIKCGTWPNLL